MIKLSLTIGSLAISTLLSRYDSSAFPLITTVLILWTTAFTSLFLYAVILYPRFFSPLRHIPGPVSDSFLLGSFPSILTQPMGIPHLSWMRTIPNKGLIRYLSFLNTEQLFPTTPEVLKELLHTKSHVFIKTPNSSKGSLARVLGATGLLFLEGEEHRQRRKTLLPAFAHGHIKNLVPSFWQRSLRLVEKVEEILNLDPAKESSVIEMARWCSLVTLDIIGSCGFGYEFHSLATAPLTPDGSQKQVGSELAEAYRRLSHPGANGAVILNMLSNFLPQMLVRNIPMQYNYHIKYAAKVIQRSTASIVAEKRLAISNKKSDPESSDLGKDILTTMLQSGQYQSDTIVKDQLMTFLIAGHETTATALSWALHAISLPENHHIQNKLRSEIHSNFPSGPPTPASISFDLVESMRYLRNVTSEVLRLYSPVGVSVRYASETTTLAGQVIPKGTTIIVAPWAINKSIELWGSDADEFNPDRWDDNPLENNYAFMTFLAGPRSCIGSLFAKVEFKCLLIALVGAFEFSQPEELRGKEVVIKGSLTNKPEGGVPVSVKRVPWGDSHH